MKTRLQKYFVTLTAGFALGVLVITLVHNSVVYGGGFGGGLGTPFGGPRVSTIMCTCSNPGSAAITITDYKNGGMVPLTLLYDPAFTDLRPFYQIYTSRYLLGNWAPGGACMIWAGKVCVPSVPPVVGTMTLVGTSQ